MRYLNDSPTLRGLGYTLNLDPDVSRVLGDLHARPGRLWRRHELLVNSVHPGEILVHVLQENYPSAMIDRLSTEQLDVLTTLAISFKLAPLCLSTFSRFRMHWLISVRAQIEKSSRRHTW